MSRPVPAQREMVAPATRTDGDLDAQLLDIFFDQMPMGIAVFGTDLRLQRCNKTWAGFFTHYLGVPAESVTPGSGLFELLPDQEVAVAPLLDGVLAGQVVRQAAHRLEQEGVVTYWDVVFAPTFSGGEVVGFVDIVTDATDRVQAYDKLEQRIAAFTAIADAMTVEHPLEQTLQQVAQCVRVATDAVAAGVIVWQDAELRTVAAYGDDGLPAGCRDAVEAAYALGARSPIRAVTTETEVSVLRGFRTTALADPGYAPLYPLWEGLGFEDVVVVPLGAHGRCVGCLLQRLARELHDSVSQALFSMTLHARAPLPRCAR